MRGARQRSGAAHDVVRVGRNNGERDRSTAPGIACALVMRRIGAPDVLQRVGHPIDIAHGGARWVILILDRWMRQPSEPSGAEREKANPHDPKGRRIMSLRRIPYIHENKGKLIVINRRRNSLNGKNLAQFCEIEAN